MYYVIQDSKVSNNKKQVICCMHMRFEVYYCSTEIYFENKIKSCLLTFSFISILSKKFFIVVAMQRLESVLVVVEDVEATSEESESTDSTDTDTELLLFFLVSGNSKHFLFSSGHFIHFFI